jgi:4-hydroxybenzoate polyprenyltransferase
MLVQLKAFFKLLRWFHEVVVIIPFVCLYLILDYQAKKNGIEHQISGFQVAVLCFAIQLLIAAGCVLNDIMDRKIDKINKPKTHIIDNTISLKGAKLIFAVLSLLIFLVSIYISIYIFSAWTYIVLIIYLLSIAYDVYFKRSPLMGNILMGLLTAMIPVVLYFFAKQTIDELKNPKITMLICLYIVWPFLIIVPRELSLDISDMEGDKLDGCKTLPILIGTKKSKLVVVGLILFTIVISIFVSWYFPYLSWSFIVVDSLLLLYLFLLQKVELRIEYIRIGRFLWFTMIIGLLLFTITALT